VNQKVEHVIALAANLQTSLDPIELSKLKKFCLLECSEEVPLVLGFWTLVVQAVQDPALE
jgi:hypothetical protein